MKKLAHKSFPSLSTEHLDGVNGGGIQMLDRVTPTQDGSVRYWQGPAEGPMLESPAADQPHELPEPCAVRWGDPSDGHLQEGCMELSPEERAPFEPSVEPSEDHMRPDAQSDFGAEE